MRKPRPNAPNRKMQKRNNKISSKGGNPLATKSERNESRAIPNYSRFGKKNFATNLNTKTTPCRRARSNATWGKTNWTSEMSEKLLAKMELTSSNGVRGTLLDKQNKSGWGWVRIKIQSVQFLGPATEALMNHFRLSLWRFRRFVLKAFVCSTIFGNGSKFRDSLATLSCWTWNKCSQWTFVKGNRTENSYHAMLTFALNMRTEEETSKEIRKELWRRRVRTSWAAFVHFSDFCLLADSLSSSMRKVAVRS